MWRVVVIDDDEKVFEYASDKNVFVTADGDVMAIASKALTESLAYAEDFASGSVCTSSREFGSGRCSSGTVPDHRDQNTSPRRPDAGT